MDQLPHAPWWACLYSISLYTYLLGCGFCHLARAILDVPVKSERLQGANAKLISYIEDVYRSL